MHLPFATTTVGYKCSSCGKVFLRRENIDRHIARLERCSGASGLEIECGVIDLTHARSTVPANVSDRGITLSGNVINGNNNHSGNVNIHQLNINVTGNPFDIVRAGTPEEAELIVQTILQSPELRRMIRTIENAPAVIFRMTKGTDGPHRLRNVAKRDKQVKELTPNGITTTSIAQYVKDAAVAMIDHLQRALGAVDTRSPADLREWSGDVARTLAASSYGTLRFEDALKMYRSGKSTFYKLPNHDVISSSVQALHMFIPGTAPFV